MLGKEPHLVISSDTDMILILPDGWQIGRIGNKGQLEVADVKRARSSLYQSLTGRTLPNDESLADVARAATRFAPLVTLKNSIGGMKAGNVKEDRIMNILGRIIINVVELAKTKDEKFRTVFVTAVGDALGNTVSSRAFVRFHLTDPLNRKGGLSRPPTRSSPSSPTKPCSRAWPRKPAKSLSKS